MEQLDITVLIATFAVLAVLGLYGAHRLFVLWVVWRTEDMPPQVRWPEGAPLPSVTVQLPVYNERAVVERLIDAACALDWPDLQVQVLDDSTDDTTALAERAVERARARGVDAVVVRRPDRVGFKAGALAHGLLTARGSHVAVFDADFVPQPDFLRCVMPFFDGPQGRIGMVQARWGHLNPDATWLTSVSHLLLDGHFLLEHRARHRSGRFFNFNGTAGVWDRRAIEDAGGWAHDTLTEDLDLSYRAQARGWSFVYQDEVVVPAELPEGVPAFLAQQARWAKGSLQTARKLLPGLLQSSLPLRVRAEALVHLTGNLAYPLVVVLALLLPLAALAREALGPSVLVFDLPLLGVSVCSIALFYGEALRRTGQGAADAWRILGALALGIGMSIAQSRATLGGLFGRDLVFVRTPKSGSVGARTRGAYRARHRGVGWPETLLGLYLCWGLVEVGSAGLWMSLPPIVLFAVGFLAVGLTGLWEQAREGAPGPRPRAGVATRSPA